jgi:hypothetical protein
MDHINVGPEERLEAPLILIGSNRSRAKDPGDLHPISRPGDIDEGVVDTQGHRVRGLSVWNRIGGLLDLDDLLVTEKAAIVHQNHAVLRPTFLFRATAGLADPPLDVLDRLGLLALCANEIG